MAVRRKRKFRKWKRIVYLEAFPIRSMAMDYVTNCFDDAEEKWKKRRINSIAFNTMKLKNFRMSYLSSGLLVGSIFGQGSPRRALRVRAAPSAKDFKKYPPCEWRKFISFVDTCTIMFDRFLLCLLCGWF